ncbi:hypothetical protein [Lentzea sp. CA-135723]|uniref:hypothetical protein n=1 Tax=Lentzea sp. CA-135723 TaxID=3239950 RepID=UPI003D8D24D7
MITFPRKRKGAGGGEKGRTKRPAFEQQHEATPARSAGQVFEGQDDGASRAWNSGGNPCPA